jgi:hypothetical protein
MPKTTNTNGTSSIASFTDANAISGLSLPSASDWNRLHPRYFPVELSDAPELFGKQRAILKAVSDELLSAIVALSKEREASSRTEASEAQTAIHLKRFDSLLPSDLIGRSLEEAQAVGVDLSVVNQAFTGFLESYRRMECRTGSMALPYPLLGEASSIYQSLLYPILPINSDLLFHHVDQGLKTLSDKDPSGFIELGTRLAWGAIACQPGLLDRDYLDRNIPPLKPEVLHLLVMVPLHRCERQVVRPRALKALERAIKAKPERSVRNLGPSDKDMETFSRIYRLAVLHQPFYEGNHRAGWMLANQWLLKNCCAYIPWDQELEEKQNALPGFDNEILLNLAPEIVLNRFRATHDEKNVRRFADAIYSKIRLLEDLD